MAPAGWLSHAFALDPPGPVTPTEAQRAIVERLAREVVRRRLTTPALLLLEMGSPLGFVSAQALHFFQPMLTAMADAGAYDELSRLLEQRGAPDYIRARIEGIERDCQARERPGTP
jgi:hypothetical protein